MPQLLAIVAYPLSGVKRRTRFARS